MRDLYDQLLSERGNLPLPRAISAPAVPATDVSIRNPYRYAIDIYITGGTVTDTAIGSEALGPQTYLRLPPRSTVKLTYSAAPTWKWRAAW